MTTYEINSYSADSFAQTLSLLDICLNRSSNDCNLPPSANSREKNSCILGKCKNRNMSDAQSFGRINSVWRLKLCEVET